jgi:hypothetical protein
MFEIFDVLFSIVVVAISYFLGWKAREQAAIRNIDAMNEELMKAQKKDVINIKLERHGGQLFVYNRETSEYMAHASNKEDLEKMLSSKYPNKQFNCSVEELEILNSK